ncbi:hypothetical protein ACRAWG_17510 [Methylobacterium sp. P31]
MDQQALIFHRRHHAAPGPHRELLSDSILQALHLHAECGSASADPQLG